MLMIVYYVNNYQYISRESFSEMIITLFNKKLLFFKYRNENYFPSFGLGIRSQAPNYYVTILRTLQLKLQKKLF